MDIATGQIPQPPALLCLSDPDAQQRFDQILRRWAKPIFCEPRELLSQCAECDPRLVVLELGTSLLEHPAALVQSVRQVSPAAFIFGYCVLNANLSPMLLEAARGGIDALAIEGCSDLTTDLMCGLEVRPTLWQWRNLSSLLNGRLHPIAMPVVSVMASGGGGVPNVSQIARLLGVSTRTLERRFASGGVPGPKRLTDLVRCLAAAGALASDAMTIIAASRFAGFESYDSFRTIVRRITGTSPRRLRDPESYGHLLQRIATEYGPPGAARMTTSAAMSRPDHSLSQRPEL